MSNAIAGTIAQFRRHRVVIRPPRALLDWELSELWAYRELLYFFIWRDIKVRYKQTVIGAAWAIIQPLATVIIFSIFLGKLVKIPSQGMPYPLFYYCALIPWFYFSNALTHATNVMVDNQRVITKVYFPRLILPLSAVLSGLLDLGIGFVVLAGMMLGYGIPLTGRVLTFPLFVLLAVMTSFGIGLWLSALNALYRDVRYAVPFLVQMWMFASPVVYPSSVVPKRWQLLYSLNPMAGVIDGFRWAAMGEVHPSGLSLFGSAVFVLLLGIGGLIYFQKMEGTIADVV